MCVTSLIRACAMAHSYVCSDSLPAGRPCRRAWAARTFAPNPPSTTSCTGSRTPCRRCEARMTCFPIYIYILWAVVSRPEVEGKRSTRNFCVLVAEDLGQAGVFTRMQTLSLSLYLSVCLSVCLSICLPACLPVGPSLSHTHTHTHTHTPHARTRDTRTYRY